MTSDADLLARACDTVAGYLALGNETIEAAGATFIHNRQTPRRRDANQVVLVRTLDVDSLLREADETFAGLTYRHIYVDALTPPEVAARLAFDGYKATEVIQMLLKGELRMTPRPADLRQVLTEDDWRAYAELDAMWWRESGESYFGPYDPDLHTELLTNMKIKAPAARSWLAYVDGVARAMFSSWPGDNGIGVIEDLFVHPDFRHRGLATALIAHCVDDARARGAGPILIAADVSDTPKEMYAALGFRPLFIVRECLKVDAITTR